MKMEIQQIISMSSVSQKITPQLTESECIFLRILRTNNLYQR